MSWRGSTDLKDRIFAVLPYLLPLFYAMQFGVFLFGQFPVLTWLSLPLIPVGIIFRSIPFASLIIFFVLFLAVVRNERISHFIRFNTMQAILIDIGLFLVGLVLSLVTRGLGGGLLLETFYNVIFLGTWAACLYAMVQSVLGRYAEIPTISEAAHSQVR